MMRPALAFLARRLGEAIELGALAAFVVFAILIGDTLQRLHLI
jgi:hypothetical protein